MKNDLNDYHEENKRRFLELKKELMAKKGNSRFLEVKSSPENNTKPTSGKKLELRSEELYRQREQMRNKELEIKSQEPATPASTEPIETISQGLSETIAEVKAPLYELLLEAEQDGLELIASIKPAQKGSIIKPEDFLIIFKEHNIKCQLDKEKIRLLCKNACHGHPQQKVLIGTGKAPQKGKDERLDFFFKPTQDVATFEKDENGNIDYRNGHLFDNVEARDKIAVILPPEKGIDGLSVINKTIHASSGLLMETKPECGEGVRWDSEEKAYFATQAGRIVYENNILMVADEYVVTSDVGHLTGNIDFVGKVTVKGGVENGFSVKGRQGLHIHSNVGKSFVESDGNIELEGGMSADEEGTIKCGGNLEARYLDAATIECLGNIKVVKELVNCDVKCGGYIQLQSGSIIGGDYMACSGIEAYDIGADLGAKTKLFVGTHYVLYDRIRTIQAKVKENDKKIAKHTEKLDLFIKYPEEFKKLPDNQKEEVKTWAQELKSLKEETTQLKEESEQLKKENAAKSNPLIIAHHALHGGVRISFRPKVSHDTVATVRKPVTVLENSQNGKLRFTREHRIAEKAFEIEKAIRRKEAEQEKARHQKERIEERKRQKNEQKASQK